MPPVTPCASCGLDSTRAIGTTAAALVAVRGASAVTVSSNELVCAVRVFFCLARMAQQCARGKLWVLVRGRCAHACSFGRNGKGGTPPFWTDAIDLDDALKAISAE